MKTQPSFISLALTAFKRLLPKDEAEVDLCTSTDVCKRKQPDLNRHCERWGEVGGG